MIKIYHNPRCRKSREGLQLLEQSELAFETILYLKNPISKEELSQIITLLNDTPLTLIRKNERIWKERFRKKELSTEQIIEAMLEYPELIERPIVTTGSEAVIGRPLENISKLLNINAH